MSKLIYLKERPSTDECIKRCTATCGDSPTGKTFYCFLFILFSLTKDLYLKEIAPAKNHYETCYDVIHFPSLDMFLWLLI